MRRLQPPDGATLGQWFAGGAKRVRARFRLVYLRIRRLTRTLGGRFGPTLAGKSLEDVES
jgi:hypothetical protein